MSAGEAGCSLCPEHSYTEEAGSMQCHCKDDYYRLPLDPPSVPCTKPPTAPQTLGYSTRQSAVVLDWKPPEDSGGRTDITYNALCSRCAVTLQACGPCDSRIEFVPQQLGLVDTAVTVVNLLPYVNYTFRVEAVNGVSDLSPAPRMYVEITVAMSQGGWQPVVRTAVIWCAMLSLCNTIRITKDKNRIQRSAGLNKTVLVSALN
ncbi:hypothetical protein scyTo_0001099 [Scyliorhinus torazame]|uniref:Fibronectin type-III domain-containing protein n=1 Tax=Scyliorhinus torazame TaxID=75743 RepID=A0A401P912_SCYTO|nr:hypothetical protein [Scyliorhinus torazame]